MSEWWTYRLSDFLMFSPATYWRMVERYNREVWPLQVVMIGVGVWLLWMVAMRRPMATRVVAGVLAALWAWVGWAFLWQRYAQINWAAEYLAVAFGLQAALLLAAAMAARSLGAAPGSARIRALGLGLAATGLLLYPLIALAAGRPWSQTEVFGLMPEPTALATLGLLIAVRRPHRGWLAIVPALALLLGMVTWWMFRS
jgi:hypothetical protein